MAIALGKIGQDSTGAWYCTVCGATRTAKNELFGGRQAVIAHLKSCTGVAGVRAGVDALVAQLGAPSPVPPRRLPADVAHGISRQPAGSVPASAMPGSTWAPYRGPVLAGSLPADSMVAALEAELAAERDRRTVAEHEASRMKGIAVDATKYAYNHLGPDHLGADTEKINWGAVAVVLGLGGVAIYWIFFSPSEDDEDEPQRTMMGSSRRSSGSALGKIADKVTNKVVDRLLGKALGMVFS